MKLVNNRQPKYKKGLRKIDTRSRKITIAIGCHVFGTSRFACRRRAGAFGRSHRHGAKARRKYSNRAARHNRTDERRSAAPRYHHNNRGSAGNAQHIFRTLSQFVEHIDFIYARHGQQQSGTVD